ncbi:MAG: excinuclease ABC subunit B [Candidatus Omnitrophota bacterium]
MLCDICHNNIATIHLTEIANDNIVEMHICQSCAKDKAKEIKAQLNISDLISGLVASDEFQKERPEGLKCTYCGLNYSEFKKKGRLGCANCYKVFSKRLTPLFKKIHGSVRHTGKAPFLKAKGQGAERIDILRNRLKRAIQFEEYEEAARLRDEIRKQD